MNNSARRIYLASPYGFSEQWKRLLLPEFIGALEALGLEVWEPFARNGQLNLAEPGWAYRVAQRDLQDVRCLLYTSPSPRDMRRSRMPSSA